MKHALHVFSAFCLGKYGNLFWEIPNEKTYSSFFFIKLIIATTHIEQNCAPQIRANEQTCNTILCLLFHSNI